MDISSAFISDEQAGKQLASLEAAGFAGAAFFGKDEIKWFADRA